VFVGHDKPLAGDLEAVIDMGVRSFLGLIREG
jgi:hypothetical protein